MRDKVEIDCQKAYLLLQEVINALNPECELTNINREKAYQNAMDVLQKLDAIKQVVTASRIQRHTNEPS